MIRTATRAIETDQCFTVSQLAKRWQCDPHRVRAFIQKGELRAFNLSAGKPNGRGCRIPADAVAAFEQARASAPALPRRGKRAELPADFEKYFHEPRRGTAKEINSANAN